MRKKILDIPIDWLTIDEAIRKIAGFVLSQKPHQITTVNPEFIVESRTNPEFKTALQSADLSLADGTGIVLAQTLNDTAGNKPFFVRLVYFCFIGLEYLLAPRSSRYTRITGVELTEHIMRRAAQDKWTVFLLGGRPGVAQTTATVWQSRYPGLTIVGTSSADPDDKDIIATIKAAKPDILLVAYGAPKQDTFIFNHKETLKVPVMIGVGGTFDTLIGKKYNPPHWIKTLGLEWLTYFFRYPNRFKRIWRATFGYLWLVARNQ